MKSNRQVDGGGIGNLIPRSYWILSPAKDLSLVILTPLLVLLVFALVGRLGWIQWLIALGLVLAVAHYLPGMIRAYGDPALFQRYWIRLLVAPAVLLGFTLTFTYKNMHAVSLMMMLWGSWHWMMQSYGFARIYDAKASSISRVTARLDQALCVVWFITVAFLIFGSFTGQLRMLYLCGAPFIPASFFSAFRMFWFGLTGLVTCWWLLHAVRMARQGNPPSPLKIIFLAVTFTFLAYTSSLAAHPIQGYVMFESCHDIQYLAIVWMFNRNRVKKDKNAGRFIQFLFRPRAGLIVLYIGICLAFGMIRNASSVITTDDVIKVTVAIVAMLAMLHYYLDGFIWKIRDEATRETLGVESARNKKSSGRGIRMRGAAGGSLRHALLWLVFIVPVVILSATQDRKLTANNVDIQQKVAESLPNSPSANISYCGLLVDLDQHELALNTCRAAVELLPREAIPYFHLGNALHGTGQLEKALAQYRRALDIDSNFAEAHFNRADALEKLGRTEEAIEHYQEAARQKPRFEAADFNRAVALDGLYRAENADTSYQTAVQIMAHTRLAHALERLGRAEEAIAHYQESVRFRPDDANVQYKLGVCLALEGRLEEAVDHLREASLLAPAHAETHYNLASALQLLSRIPEAVLHYQESVRIKPDYAMAHYNLGTCLAMQDRLDAAAAQFREVLRLEPGDTSARDNLRKIEVRRQQNSGPHRK